jgi:hypothetical protein
MKRLASHVKGLTAILFASALAFSFAGTASALPVSDFTTSSTAVAVNEPVTFTFTGNCDLEPCRIMWRSFVVGGSSLGSTIGEGPEVVFAFGAPGVYFVVAKITNAGSTHGSSSSTQVITVGAVVDPPVVDPSVVDTTAVSPPVVDPPVVDPSVVDTTAVSPPVDDTTVVSPPVVEPTVVDPPVATDPSVVTDPPSTPPSDDDDSGSGHGGGPEDG